MSVADELSQLGDLHQRGVLSDAEFASAKARVLNGTANARSDTSTMTAVNAFRRSRNDRWLGGVCGGIGAITGIASWVWRLLFVLMVLCGGTGLLFYALLWIFVPDDGTRTGGQPGSLHTG